MMKQIELTIPINLIVRDHFMIAAYQIDDL